jgi:Ran GTPase-activating protein (RanGAP) involved in mRNA processing and transport
MSKDAFLQLSEGLNTNTTLTDFFFTHNDLQAAGEGGVALI